MNKHEDAKADEVERLLPMIRRGSNAAFLRLSELYAPLLEREVARYAASLPPADLDDLRQSASVSLYRAALAFHGDRGVTFGLFAKICIVNGIADSLRYIRGKGTMLSMEDLDEREQPDGDEPNPQSLLLDKEQGCGRRGGRSKRCFRRSNMRFLKCISAVFPMLRSPRVSEKVRSRSTTLFAGSRKNSDKI